MSPDLVVGELQSFAATQTFDALVHDLSTGAEQTGRILLRPGHDRLGRDRLCLPRQAKRALTTFPGATLQWFEHSGHSPLWDQPEETVRLILDAAR